MGENKVAALLAKYEKSGMLPKMWDSVDYLALLIFAQASDFTAATAALKRMKAAFIDYNDMRAARWPEVARALDPLPSADFCTRRLTEMLFRLFDNYGMMSLRTLANRTVAEAKAELVKIEPHLSKDAAQIALFGVVPNFPLNLSDSALTLAKDHGIISRAGNRTNLQKTLIDSNLPPEKYGMLARFLEIEAALNAAVKKAAAKSAHKKSPAKKTPAPAAKKSKSGTGGKIAKKAAPKSRAAKKKKSLA